MVKLLFFLILPLHIFAADLIFIPSGSYKPILSKGKEIIINGFYVDENAVTNKEFSEFVQKNSKWLRGNAAPIFVDINYLKHWKKKRKVGDKRLENSPVVNVSWFAAMAYCDWKNKRLPTVDEWEYLAQFGSEDNSRDVSILILEWYSKETLNILPNVKSTFKNKFGVWDIHGLIWEWNLDFNSSFVTGESRGDAALEKGMFCGAGSLGAANPRDYAAFMRFAFRSSLDGNYTVGSLGFRCARSGK